MTEKSSNEWDLSDDESETEDTTNQQQGRFFPRLECSHAAQSMYGELLVLESDSEPEETTVRVSRPYGSCKGGSKLSALVTTSPQKGILKDKKSVAMTLSKEEQKKRVRFSLEGKSPIDTNDHSDLSSNEDDTAVEMEAGDSDEDEFAETDDLGEIKKIVGVYVTITDALIINASDMEDSDDLSEQSDDGYIETESSSEDSEEEMEGESEDEATTPLLAAASANDGASHTYVPPHLRDGRTSKNQERLRKTVQGLINR